MKRLFATACAAAITVSSVWGQTRAVDRMEAFLTDSLDHREEILEQLANMLV